jgi:hypothetical protein
MMVEEGDKLEGRAPCAQLPALKIRSKIEILETQIFSEKIEEMIQHTAHRSARNNSPRDLEHPCGVEIEEEREDKKPLSRISFSESGEKSRKPTRFGLGLILRGPHLEKK